MSATLERSATRQADRGHGFAGTGHLVRLALRRDRVRLPLWVFGIAITVGLSAGAVPGLYKTQAQIDGYAALVGSSPATVAMAGPPLGLDTLAGIVIYEVSLTLILGVSLMSILTVSRLARAEEETGRTEVLRATGAGRHASGAAALIVASGASLAVGLLVTVILMVGALSAASAVLLGLGMALLGMAYGAAALVFSQVFVHARTVSGAGLAFFATGYVLRAAGDVREDWLVWLSPIGWVQAVHVPTENRAWPLVVPLLFTLLLTALAVLFADRRDFGAGLIPARPGAIRAGTLLGGPAGLSWRLQRGAVLAWAIGFALLAALTASLGSSIQDMLRDNPMLADYLAATGGDVVESYLATMLVLFGVAAAGFAVWSFTHDQAEEESGRRELVLAGPVGRLRDKASGLLVTVVGVLALFTAVALAMGATHARIVDDVEAGLRAGLSAYAFLPPVLVVLGIVVLVDGWLPKATWVGWLVVAYATVIGWLGGLLDPPEWMVQISPFSHVPGVPAESLTASSMIGLTAVAVALLAAGLAGYRRRDVG